MKHSKGRPDYSVILQVAFRRAQKNRHNNSDGASDGAKQFEKRDLDAP